MYKTGYVEENHQGKIFVECVRWKKKKKDDIQSVGWTWQIVYVYFCLTG